MSIIFTFIIFAGTTLETVVENNHLTVVVTPPGGQPVTTPPVPVESETWLSQGVKYDSNTNTFKAIVYNNKTGTVTESQPTPVVSITGQS